MNEPGANIHEVIEDLRIMTFRMMGIKMGVDVDQIAQMLTPEEAGEREIDVLLFHEQLSSGAMDAAYSFPKVLLPRKEGAMNGIMIDEPQDIIGLKADAIRPLPPLLDTALERRVIWGVALIDNEIILLVDLYSLIQQKHTED